METILNLLTRANITLLLSIIGTVGAISSLISSLLHKRKHLRICISNVGFNQDTETLMIAITFENKSQLPIAITDVVFVHKGIERINVPYPRCVSTYTHKVGTNIIDRINTYNAKLPIDINPLSAKSEYFLFDIPTEVFQILDTDAFLLVHSTRGKAMKISLPYIP